MRQWAKVFRALGNPDRLRLFFLLTQRGEGICVCELVEALGLPQYSVSKHLRALREVGLIESTREGRWAYYFVSPAKRVKELSAFLSQAIPAATISTELARLGECLARREGGRCVIGPGPDGGADD